MAEVASRSRAICSMRAATVGPVGVRMQVAAQRGTDAGTRSGIGRGLRLQSRQVLRCAARQSLFDHLPGRAADAGQALQPTLRREPAELLDGAIANRVGRFAERLRLISRRPRPFEQCRNAIERFGGIHSREGTLSPDGRLRKIHLRRTCHRRTAREDLRCARRSVAASGDRRLGHGSSVRAARRPAACASARSSACRCGSARRT